MTEAFGNDSNDTIICKNENTKIEKKNIDLTKYKIINEEYIYEDMNEGAKEKIKVIYLEKNTKYYENLKKAKDRYIENNREKVNEQHNIRYKERYVNDAEFREKIKQKRREYYAKNKK
jgi:hypothetical protein